MIIHSITDKEKTLRIYKTENVIQTI